MIEKKEDIMYIKTKNVISEFKKALLSLCRKKIANV